MARFESQICLITGAGSGIGEQTAIRLASEGATVILVGRTRSKLEKVAALINETMPTGNAEVFVCDVTEEKDILKLRDFVEDTFGEVHILINNAGGSNQATISEMTIESWDHVQNTNIRSVFLVSKIISELMKNGKEQNRSIVNVASLSGHKAGAQIPHYSAAKAGVINLTRALAVELSSYGIRANSVSPGFIETPLTEEGLTNIRFEEAIKRKTALGRVGQPVEIANVIAFIASSEASYMTGSDVLVDGGWLIV